MIFGMSQNKKNCENLTRKNYRIYNIEVFGVCESIGIVRFHVRPGTWLLHIISFHKMFYFQLNALKPAIYLGFGALFAPLSTQIGAPSSN